MPELTDAQIEFMRADLECNMGYSKIMMISEFIDKTKKENPNITNEELRKKVAEFRKEKGWDK